MRHFVSAPLDAELLCRPHPKTAYSRRQRDGSLFEYCGNLGDERNLLAGAQCASCEGTAVEGSENLLGHFVGERDHPVQFRRICHSSLLPKARRRRARGNSPTARLEQEDRAGRNRTSAIEMIGAPALSMTVRS